MNIDPRRIHPNAVSHKLFALYNCLITNACPTPNSCIGHYSRVLSCIKQKKIYFDAEVSRNKTYRDKTTQYHLGLGQNLRKGTEKKQPSEVKVEYDRMKNE